MLTLKQLETHGCILSIVATDALVLKHQAISILSAEKRFIVLDQFQTTIDGEQYQKIQLYYEKKTQLYKG